MADGIDISATLNKQDIRAFNALIIRNSKEFGKSLKSSLQFAAWSIAGALAASTKIAPKFRPYRKVKEARKKRGEERYGALYEVDFDRSGKKFTRQVRAKSVGELKKKSQVMVRNYGLAAASWSFAQSKLGKRDSVGAKIAAHARKKASSFGAVTFHKDRTNPKVTIQNKLNYAYDAFKTSGRQTVANVMERAVKRMAHVIEGKLAKAMKAA